MFFISKITRTEVCLSRSDFQSQNRPSPTRVPFTRVPFHEQFFSLNFQTQKQSSGYVRGFIAVSGYLIQPYESFNGKENERPSTLLPGMCLVTLCAHTELGGSLPSSVINSLSTGAPIKILQGISGVVTQRS